MFVLRRDSRSTSGGIFSWAWVLPGLLGRGRRWKVGDSWAGAGGQPAITPCVFTEVNERGGVSRPQDTLYHSDEWERRTRFREPRSTTRRVGAQTHFRRWVDRDLRKKRLWSLRPGARWPLAQPYVGASIFAGYAHSVDSNAPGEWCVE